MMVIASNCQNEMKLCLGTCEVLYDGFVHGFTLGHLNGEWHGMCGAMCYVIATCSPNEKNLLVYDHTKHV